MADAAQAAIGGVDIPVNHAALTVELQAAQAVDIAVDEWTRSMDVNVTGALHCVQALAPGNTTSDAGEQLTPAAAVR